MILIGWNPKSVDLQAWEWALVLRKHTLNYVTHRFPNERGMRDISLPELWHHMLIVEEVSLSFFGYFKLILPRHAGLAKWS
jgi:hypothetical protein